MTQIKIDPQSLIDHLDHTQAAIADLTDTLFSLTTSVDELSGFFNQLKESVESWKS